MELKKPKLHIHKNGRIFGFGVSPADDWRIIFSSLIGLGLTASLLGIYMFVKINNRELFVVEKEAPTSENNLNKNLLSKTVNYYKAKVTELDSIVLNKEILNDPSI